MFLTLSLLIGTLVYKSQRMDELTVYHDIFSIHFLSFKFQKNNDECFKQECQ